MQKRDHLVQRRQISKSTKVTLRSWYNRVNWLYGVKKIRIKWLWPVKVTLEIIKRRLLVFCWSCDGVPLKWNKKNSEPPVCHYESIEPTLASQFVWSVNTFKMTLFQSIKNKGCEFFRWRLRMSYLMAYSMFCLDCGCVEGKCTCTKEKCCCTEECKCKVKIKYFLTFCHKHKLL